MAGHDDELHVGRLMMTQEKATKYEKIGLICYISRREERGGSTSASSRLNCFMQILQDGTRTGTVKFHPQSPEYYS